MVHNLRIQPLGWTEKSLDRLCEPFMRWVSGAPSEAPQETHRWNNTHLHPDAVRHLRSELMVVRTKGDPDAKLFVPPFTGVFAHLTRFGGWTHYIAIEPFETGECWHLGCRWPGGGVYNGAVLSRIPTFGGVRVLLGPGPAEWFGISAWDYRQLALRELGEGKIGDGKLLTRLPLR